MSSHGCQPVLRTACSKQWYTHFVGREIDNSYLGSTSTSVSMESVWPMRRAADKKVLSCRYAPPAKKVRGQNQTATPMLGLSSLMTPGGEKHA
ncbi:hypothetical protein X797_011624 [Metarhizium robertsii]|uniref:Uncharacterized protein n=1 Tax=Metarhizium robertsii TaxID=568076 RepID=A0A014P1Y5_9HYPO|nr:hypothetical protein X797_011624 [Metarhizium robertsii]